MHSFENKNQYDEEGKVLKNESTNDFFWARKNRIRLPMLKKTIILTNCQVFQWIFGINKN